MDETIHNIIWKYTWLDESKFFYLVQTNIGHRYLLTLKEGRTSKVMNQSLFFTSNKRISKLKGRLLW